MMEFLQKLLEFLGQHQAELPAMITGGVGGVLLSLLGARLYNRSESARMRIEMARLRERAHQLEAADAQQKALIHQLAAERDQQRSQSDGHAGVASSRASTIDGLTLECERLKEHSGRVIRRLAKSRRRRRALAEQVDILSRRLDDMDKSDGKIWNRPAMGTVAPFRPLSVRRTPIVSVVNLKGGVGKTTITANLGVAIASTGRRVLLIDMDHQGSLTSHLLAGTDVLHDASNSGRLVDEVFRDGEAGREGLVRGFLRVAHVSEGELMIVGANEKLDDAETKLMERWLSRSIPDDARYRLRKLLHDPEVATRFDVILIDCPPRLTTGCINAVTASDYVFVPVLPEQQSTDAVPRLFGRLSRLRNSVCPDLAALGVVGNKVKFYGGKPMSRHKVILQTMADECVSAWGQPVRLHPAITAHEVYTAKFAALDMKFRDGYLTLVDSLIREMPTHARLRSPGVPAVLDHASEGVGG